MVPACRKRRSEVPCSVSRSALTNRVAIARPSRPSRVGEKMGRNGTARYSLVDVRAAAAAVEAGGLVEELLFRGGGGIDEVGDDVPAFVMVGASVNGWFFTVGLFHSFHLASLLAHTARYS